MHLGDLLPPADVRQADNDLTVESPWSEQSRVKHVRTVGRRNDDNTVIALEPIHFHQQLIESLFALIVSTAQAGPPMTAHGIDFVDKDNARGLLLRLLEHIAHPRRADTHKHFDEV